jgi:hypothetical protein
MNHKFQKKLIKLFETFGKTDCKFFENLDFIIIILIMVKMVKVLQYLFLCLKSTIVEFVSWDAIGSIYFKKGMMIQKRLFIVFLSDLDGLAPFLRISHFQATTWYGG